MRRAVACSQQQIFHRHAGTRNHAIDAVEPSGLLRRPNDSSIGKPGETRPFLSLSSVSAAQIANPHGRPALREKARAFPAGARQSDNQNFFAVELHADHRRAHRSFNVLKPITAQINERIQNRTMICGSFQPLSS